MHDQHDDLLFLSEAAKLLPSSRAGKKVHVSTLFRWIHKKQLRGWWCPRLRVWKVSRADIEAKVREAEPVPWQHNDPPPRTRQAEIKAARQRLVEMGMMQA